MRKYGEKHRAQQAERRNDNMSLIRECKLQHPCVLCGEDTPEVLDFHHLDPTQKDFTIGTATNYSWSKLKSEIEKCVVVCKNCHTKIHAKLVTLMI